ncbi:type VI secretion lipoprotein [Azorhizobium oxalatiphilum]|uniref:Type VI secretion lipoprotein n=2 Tax=Azorhizobium oxalatiphilum TaxID=980631 RepID=A0A917BVG9_9HYPH|nr:type VI secretion lipoprotein [Azorhizobium oxalatiphilum]
MGDGAGLKVRLARRSFVLGGLAGLTGCAAIPVPPPKPTIIGVRFLADNTINPSPTGVPSPVTVRLYVLKDDTNFMQSDFTTLYTQDAAVLGASMLSKKEIVVPVNGNIPVQDTVPPEATLLGVIAAFRTIDTAQWRATIGLQAGLVNDVQLNLTGTTATFEHVVVGQKGLPPLPPFF